MDIYIRQSTFLLFTLSIVTSTLRCSAAETQEQPYQLHLTDYLHAQYNSYSTAYHTDDEKKNATIAEIIDCIGDEIDFTDQAFPSDLLRDLHPDDHSEVEAQLKDAHLKIHIPSLINQLIIWAKINTLQHYFPEL